MRRVPAQARKRSRILSDDELRAVWKAAEAGWRLRCLRAAFAADGQRREKVATMKWSDLDGDVWTIPTAPREKGNPGVLEAAAAGHGDHRAQPRIAGNPYVFHRPQRRAARRLFGPACRLQGALRRRRFYVARLPPHRAHA